MFTHRRSPESLVFKALQVTNLNGISDLFLFRRPSKAQMDPPMANEKVFLNFEGYCGPKPFQPLGRNENKMPFPSERWSKPSPDRWGIGNVTRRLRIADAPFMHRVSYPWLPPNLTQPLRCADFSLRDTLAV